MAVGFERIFVLFEPHCEVASSLPYIRFFAIWARLFVCSEACEFVGGWCWGISSFWMVLVVRKAILRSVFLKRLVMNVAIPLNLTLRHLIHWFSLHPHWKQPNPPRSLTRRVPPKRERTNTISRSLSQEFMQPQDENPYLHNTDWKHLFICYTRGV